MKDNAELLEGNSHMGDNIRSGKSDMKKQKDSRLCLAASRGRADTNGMTKPTINSSNPSDSRYVITEKL